MYKAAQKPHDDVIDLHERGGSVKASQICIYHLRRASSKQTAPVGKNKKMKNSSVTPNTRETCS